MLPPKGSLAPESKNSHSSQAAVFEKFVPPSRKGGTLCIKFSYLLKILISWLAKHCHLNLGKIVFEKFSDKSLSKISIETQEQHEKSACSKEK